MRIQRLDLLRYGHFEDKHIELPASKSDFHILFGPNEAGKSTALCAIEDLLFGIRSNSPYNFRYDYGSMRIGAILQNGENTLELRRRKGNKDTLLTADDLPIASGSGALAPFLVGVDQTFFERMFSLDHERLRKGGREILEAQDEVGQMLFAAGAGLSGLRERLKALTNEADGLWASRKAVHRKYYQASDRLEVAEKALREHTITATKWQEIKRAYDDSQEAYDAIEKEIEGVSGEQRKLSRIRRVFRDIRKIITLKEEITALGSVVPLPEDAYSKLDTAEREHTTATTRVETHNEQLQNERSQHDALKSNEELLLRDDDIQQFHKRRIEVQKEKADLPNRHAELASAVTNLRRLAEELEWETDDVELLMKKIPPRVKVATVRTLLNSRGEKASDIGNAKYAVEEIENQIADLKQELDGKAASVDVSKLAALVKATRESDDIGLRIKAAEDNLRETSASIERCLKFLKLQITEEEMLALMLVPTRDRVQNHRDAVRSADQQMQACRERISTAELDLTRHRKAQERLARDEAAIAPRDVTDARELRDTGWSLIRRHYVENAFVPEAELRAFTGTEANLPDAYEAAIGTADSLADRRYENANAAAQIAITSRQIAEQQELLEGLLDQERKLAEERQVYETSWQEMWDEAPFEPLAPDLMLEWLTSRNEVLEAVDHREGVKRQLEALRNEESEAKTRVLTEMLAVSADGPMLDDQPLRVIMEAAAAVQSRHETDATNRRQSEDRLRKMTTEADRKCKASETAEAAWTNWQTEWIAAIEVMGLGMGKRPEAVATQLDNIDRMREIAVEINQLRHERIEKIERDIDVFTQDVKALVAVVAKDLAKASPEDAILDIERRLDETKRIREQKNNIDITISSLKKKIADCENSARDARETIRRLKEAAGAIDIDQLKTAIQSSDNLRQLEGESSRITDILAKEGDGFSVDELSNECDAVDIDQVASRDQALEQELKELRVRQMESAERCTQMRTAFEAIGGDARAAEAAALRQAALAEMREVAEQYVHVRAAATVLQWAIDRYRREKQAPLLKRAGEIFATLTGGSFSDLRLEFDENDKAQLAGLRPDGRLVSVGGMSTGTADQLYLALRVASVEDYLGRASAIPFVADDLFINFDDERAAAGFKVLGQLAHKTQILFFTHHRHLVEIAQTTLGGSLAVVSLLERPDASTT